MAAPARFAEILDRKTTGSTPAGAPRRMGLWTPQAVWLYQLPILDLDATRASSAWLSSGTPCPAGAPPPGEPPASASERRARSLTRAAREALALLRRLGAVELDDHFSQSDVKRAFRRLALRLHPDRHPGASASERLRLARSFSAMTDAVGLLIELP